MAIKKDAKLFKPETVDERYLHFLLTGEGKVEELPSPTTIGEQYLYHMCVDGVKVVNSDATVVGGGVSGEGTSEQPQAVVEEAKPYVQANVKSDAGNQNYLGIIYDGGEAKETRPTDVSVKFRFKLKDIQGEKPLTAGIRLVNSEKGEKDVLDAPNDYAIQKAGVIQNPEYGKEYVIEEKYQPTDTNGKPFGQRYIRPFLMTGKSIKDVTHSIEILEATLTVDGIAHDLTTSIVDFAPLNGEGNIKVVTPEPTVVAPTSPVAGKDGVDGKDGKDGVDGSVWFNGVGDPVKEKTVGVKANDYYLQDDGKVWKFVGDEWKFTTISLKGAKGEDGEDGVSVVAQPQTETTPIHYLIDTNSESAGFNFVGAMYDSGEAKGVDTAKVKFRFIVRDNGNPIPTKIGLNVFANDNQDPTVIADGYTKDYGNGLISEGIEFGKEFVLEQELEKGAFAKYRYIKPFLKLSKSDKATTHRVDVLEIKLTVNGVEKDILSSANYFVPFQKEKCSITKQGGEVVTTTTTVQATSPFMPFKGKKIACLGDSITWGYDGAGTGQTQVAKPWVEQLKEKCGFAEAVNLGISGSSMGNYSDRNPMFKRVNTIPEDADVISIMGLTNDFSLNPPLPLGKPEDMANKEGNTVYSAVSQTLLGVIARCPGARIFIMTPMDWKNNNGNTKVANNGVTFKQYRDVIKEVAETYSIPVFELHKEAGFNADFAIHRKMFIPDGVHPNQAGYDIMADKISKFINHRL